MNGSPQERGDPIAGEGTPESDWASWHGLHALPLLPMTLPLPEPGPVLVVSAHPDDDVLGFGGTMSQLASSGREIRLLSVTDGEGSHPNSARMTPRQLAEVRCAETHGALGELGLSTVEPERMRVPDTQVSRHEGDVTARMEELLRSERCALCVAPWTLDVHGDHEAAGRAAVAACRSVGVALWLYPVWLWHWARPGDPRVPWGEAARIELPQRALDRKNAALDWFVSQTRPLGPGQENSAVLPPDELSHHQREFEVVFR